MADTLTLPQILNLPPARAVEALKDRGLNDSYTRNIDLYARLYLASILRERCDFDIAHINNTIAFFKSRGSIPVAATLLNCVSSEGKERLKQYAPTDAQVEGICETAKLIELLTPVVKMFFPDYNWTNFPKFNANEVDRALVKSREILLGMRIPSNRKPKRDIELDAECAKKIGFSRESIGEKDYKSLYNILCNLIGADNISKEYDSPDFLRRTLEALFDRVIQEEKRYWPLFQSQLEMRSHYCSHLRTIPFTLRTWILS